MVRLRKQLKPSRVAIIEGSSTANLTASEAIFPGSGTNSESEEERDWAQLFPEIVAKIGNHLLRDDLSEYIRLRAVCQPWRRATANPSTLEPRFFPRNWLLLAPRNRRLGTNGDGAAERFVNVRTGASLRIRLPTPKEYTHHGNAEGLLVLRHRFTHEVCLVNPLTLAAFTDPPSITTVNHSMETELLFRARDIKAAGVLVDADEQGRARPSPDPPTVVLSLSRGTHTVLVCAKAGQPRWHVVDTSHADDTEGKLPTIKGGLSVRGRFFIPTRAGDVLEVVLQPRPHLTFVARQTGSFICSGLSESSYIVPSENNTDDGMILVRKTRGIEPTFLTCTVDLKNSRVIPMPARLTGITVLLPSVTLCGSSFPSLPQNGVCCKHYLENVLRGEL